MGRDGLANFLSVNGSLMSLDGPARPLRLPRTSPFPKLDGRMIRSAHGAGRPAAQRGAVIMVAGGSLPEVATDVIDGAAQYAVENVKRGRAGAHPWSPAAWGQWVGRLFGGARAARP
jgi:hypothetical protein